MSNKRKALITRQDLDLTQRLTEYNDDIVEAMRLRILELEERLASADQPPAKRARKSTAAAPAAAESSEPLTAAQQKKEDKKVQAQVKKLFDRLKKECKSADVKFQGTPKQVKFDEVLEKAEFDTIFNGRGTLIQPTPENKSTSTVTIIELSGAQAEMFFSEGGAKLEQLKGTRWSRGGGPYFQKSNKLGPCEVDILAMHVQFSTNSMKCTLKFDVREAGGGDREDLGLRYAVLFLPQTVWSGKYSTYAYSKYSSVVLLDYACVYNTWLHSNTHCIAGGF